MRAGLYQQPREGSVAQAALPRLDVAVGQTLEDCLGDWSRFEATARGTLFQTSTWCRAWAETVGRQKGAAPRIVMGRDGQGALRFILPLQIRRRQGARVLEWMTAPHHNYGYGLYDASFLPLAGRWFEAHLDGILASIGGFDAVALTEMPDRYFDQPHPLAHIATLRAANPSFMLRLDPDFAGLYQRKRSGEHRRKARRDEAALARTGTIAFGLPEGGKPELHRLLDTMFDQQRARLAELGIHNVFGAEERAFVHRLAVLQDEGRPILAPFRLTRHRARLAVAPGGLHGNGYWALISSLGAHDVRKHSPGEVLLRKTIEACCEARYDFVDLASGDAAYKRAWADGTVPMSVALRAVNPLGLAWAAATAARIAVKRRVKQSPLMFGTLARARRALLGKRG